MPKKELFFEKKFSFDQWDKKEISRAFKFAEGYKEFLTDCKTEREVVRRAENLAKKQGYRPMETVGPVDKNKKSAGDKFYGINRGKSIILARLGRKPVKEGLRLVLSHADSPRLDLKLRPLYEGEHLCFLKTHYYGGIKKYQWPCLPLSMHGIVVREDGKIINIEIGEKKEDPIFIITDLLPHLAQKQMEKKMSEGVAAEELNLVIGSMSQKTKDTKDSLKSNILKILNDKYGIKEEDFVSADLEIVPAGPARDVGLDSSLIAAYGQDDRICAYTSLQALFDTDKSEYTSLVVLVDREEIGSEGVTGATSNFIIDFISELLYLQEGEHDENYLRDALSLSKAISADVTVGFDPDYADVFDSQNTARIGAGIVIEKYAGRGGKYSTSEATAEYMAYVRNIYNQAKIEWQTGGLGKIDLGGGGTIAMFLARHNMDVVDSGPAVLSMHSPFEISSKADVYTCYKAYKAFLQVKQ